MNSLKYANMQCSRDRASQACSDGGLYMYDRKKCVERVRSRGYHSSKTHNPSNRQIRVNDLSKKGGVEEREKNEVRRRKWEFGVLLPSLHVVFPRPKVGVMIK